MLQYGPRLMLLASLESAKPRLQQNVPPNLSIDDMPTYDYECDACGHQFEVFQGINDEVLTKCPECNKKKLKRLFGSGAAIVFKGSGFYQTDYRSEGYKKAAAADSKSKSSEKSKSSTKKKSSGGKDSK